MELIVFFVFLSTQATRPAHTADQALLYSLFYSLQDGFFRRGNFLLTAAVHTKKSPISLAVCAAQKDRAWAAALALRCSPGLPGSVAVEPGGWAAEAVPPASGRRPAFRCQLPGSSRQRWRETCSFIPDQPFLRAKKQAVSPVFPALTTFYRKTQKLSSDNVAENVVYGSFLAKMKEACAKCRKMRRHKNFCAEWGSSPGFQIISFQIRPKNNFTARCCSCSTCGTNHSV